MSCYGDIEGFDVSGVPIEEDEMYEKKTPIRWMGRLIYCFMLLGFVPFILVGSALVGAFWGAWTLMSKAMAWYVSMLEDIMNG